MINGGWGNGEAPLTNGDPSRQQDRIDGFLEVGAPRVGARSRAPARRARPPCAQMSQAVNHVVNGLDHRESSGSFRKGLD